MDIEKILNSDIYNFSVDELLLLPSFIELAREAKDAVNTIFQKVTFQFGQYRVLVWADAYNREYVTQDGVWQARYYYKAFDVILTEESIFKIYKDAFMFDFFIKENGYSPSGDLSYLCDSVEIASYFRSFISKLQKTKVRGA